MLKPKPFISDKIKKYGEILQNNIENNIPKDEKKVEIEKNNDTLFNIINLKKIN